MKHSNIFYYLFIITSCLVIYTLAWGKSGHAVVGKIAQTQLTTAASTYIQQLLTSRFNTQQLADVASWPDDVLYNTSNPDYNKFPWSKTMHYINVEYNWPRVWVPDALKNCTSTPCVITAIQNFTKFLSTPGNSAASCGEALSFLTHFVGDLHQPLHCGYRLDLGGNLIRVYFLNNSTIKPLHSVWDDGMIDALTGIQDYMLLYGYVVNETSRLKPDQLTGFALETDVTRWAEESYALVRTVVYEYQDVIGDPNAQGFITSQYLNQNVRVAMLRIIMAGMRLGALLNSIVANGTLCTGPKLPSSSKAPFSSKAASSSKTTSSKGPNKVNSQKWIILISAASAATGIVMGIGVWLFARNRRRKQMSNEPLLGNVDV